MDIKQLTDWLTREQKNIVDLRNEVKELREELSQFTGLAQKVRSIETAVNAMQEYDKLFQEALDKEIRPALQRGGKVSIIARIISKFTKWGE